MGQMAEDGEIFWERHGHEMFQIPDKGECKRCDMNYRAHDGINPAPGDDDPQEETPDLDELLEDDEEDEDDEDDEEDDDDDADIALI